MPSLHVEGRQLTETLRSEVRVDVAPNRLAVTYPRRQGDFGLDAVEPQFEEVAHRRARRSDERPALHTRQRIVERGLCFRLRAEAADIALASLADVIEAEVEPVAPRSTVGSMLANAPSHAPSRRCSGHMWAIRGHGARSEESAQIRNGL
jgi:hypothetical protein